MGEVAVQESGGSRKVGEAEAVCCLVDVQINMIHMICRDFDLTLIAILTLTNLERRCNFKEYHPRRDDPPTHNFSQ